MRCVTDHNVNAKLQHVLFRVPSLGLPIEIVSQRRCERASTHWAVTYISQCSPRLPRWGGKCGRVELRRPARVARRPAPMPSSLAARRCGATRMPGGAALTFGASRQPGMTAGPPLSTSPHGHLATRPAGAASGGIPRRSRLGARVAAVKRSVIGVLDKNSQSIGRAASWAVDPLQCCTNLREHRAPTEHGDRIYRGNATWRPRRRQTAISSV